MVKGQFWLFCLVLAVFLADAGAVFAQDPEFSQFYANPLYLNPAMAGTARCARFVMNYRDEWPGVSGVYNTYHASYDQHIDALSGGIGLMAMQDVAGAGGILNRTWLSGVYAYQTPITRDFSISVGFQATYAQLSVDWSKLSFGDQIDPKMGFIYQTLENTKFSGSKGSLDLSTGILGYSKRFYFGAAFDHLTQPQEALLGGVSTLPLKITAHAGAVIPLEVAHDGSETTLSPNILYMQQMNIQQLLLGVYFNKGPLTAGLWYRNSDAFIILIGFQQSMFKIGYSYDVTVSSLATATAGSHEISLQYVIPCRPQKRKFRTTSCPSF